MCDHRFITHCYNKFLQYRGLFAVTLPSHPVCAEFVVYPLNWWFSLFTKKYQVQW